MSLKALSEVSEWEKVSPQIIAVGFHLANCANGKTGLSFPSIEYLSNKTSLSMRSIQRILSEMEDRKLIIKEYRYKENGRQTTTNYLFLHDTHNTPSLTPITPSRGDTHNTPLPDTHNTPLPDTSVTQKQEVVKQEVVKQEKKREEIKKIFVLPADIDPELWEGFMQTRKKLKAQNTPLAIKLLLTTLDKCVAAGFTRNEAISEAIERGWKSVKPEWLKNNVKSGMTGQQKHEANKADLMRSMFGTNDDIKTTYERVQ